MGPLSYSPLAMLLGYLKGRSELTGIPVAADLIGHTTGAKLIRPILKGGERAVRDRADWWDFAIEVYGPDKRTVEPLSMTVRSLLLEKLPGSHLDGVTVSDVYEIQAPFDSPDSDSSEQRFINLVTVFCYS